MTWDHHRQVHEVNTHLHELVGMTTQPAIGIFGGIVTIGFLTVLGGMVDFLIRKKHPGLFRRQNLLQYFLTVNLIVLGLFVPIKMVLKLAFNIKYIWVTPWFNV
jgi:hypothetical protein